MDISLVEENKSDYTFFKIDEDENEDNDTLKALKQTYVTSNYKNETILNLQKELNSNSQEISKEIKLESYNRYNNALDLAHRNYISKALEFAESALKINPKDVDILNLKGLLCLLKCDFSKAFESFYTGQCYGNNELSRKYVTLLSSKDFKIFLERYNHSIRFINEELTEESIEIFDSLILEEPDLIEPYVISILLYDKMGNLEKKRDLLADLRCVDRDNPIFERFNENGEDITTLEKKEEPKAQAIKNNNKKAKPSKEKQKGSKIPYVIIALLILGIGIFYFQNQKKIENLNKEIASKEETISEKDKQLTEKQDELTKKEEAEKEAELKKQEEAIENSIKSKGAENLYFTAVKYQQAGDYNAAIKYYRYAVQAKDTSKYNYICIYNIALCYQKLNDTDNAIKYYNQFINTYPASNDYYDDASYNIAVLYDKTGQTDKAQGILYALRINAPNSPYNKSEAVKKILSK